MHCDYVGHPSFRLKVGAQFHGSRSGSGDVRLGSLLLKWIFAYEIVKGYLYLLKLDHYKEFCGVSVASSVLQRECGNVTERQ